MKPFLQTVAERIIEERKADLENTVIVFPNRRPIIFLKQHIANTLKATSFMPKTMCIDDLVAELSQLEITDNVFLLFELFQIHTQTSNTKYRNFEEFIPFADMLLHDFSEIDAYCADAEMLFSNLHDIKAIGEWDVSGEELTTFQKNYLEFYKSLFTYYSKLRTNLLEKGKAYSGMAYRKVAENTDMLAPYFAGKKVYFVGFNALNFCEERIIKLLTNNGIGTLITDGDDYYYKNEEQEAGKFLNRLHEKGITNLPTEYGDSFGQGEKTINVVSCPENILQAKITGSLLNNLDSYNDTAVVLADESLLVPMLNSLPQKVTAANITMGFPYTYTSLHNFVSDLFNLHINAKGNSFHHKDVIKILSSSFVQTLANNKNINSNIRNYVYNERLLYSTAEKIFAEPSLKTLEPGIGFLFSEEASTPEGFYQMCRTLIGSLMLSPTFNDQKYVKEQVALDYFSKIIEHFAELSAGFHFVQNITTLQKIYSKMAVCQRLSFKGEPLVNLQILGMLETRSLDFAHIFLLSTNESRLPQGKSSKSLIPLSLKRAFGMPTYQENDSIYAYHFYRLLQRCNDVWLIYNSDTNGDGKGEPSRFIQQIKEELVPKYDNISIKEHTLSVSEANKTITISEAKEVVKTNEIMAQILQTAQNGFSPSALNKYNNCPLRYYYENILHIKEAKEIDDNIDKSEIGSVIHSLLEEFFAPEQYPNGYLNKELLTTYLNTLDEKLSSVLDAKYTTSGKDYLCRSIIKSIVTNFLKQQIKDLEAGKKVQIKELEKKYTHNITIGSDGGTTAKIIGTIDRIDIENGNIRIIDYKSGSVKDSDLKFIIGQTDKESIKDKCFQLLTYSWLYTKEQDITEPLTAGIYALNNFSSSFMKLQMCQSPKKVLHTFVTDEILAAFETILLDIIGEILDPEVPFVAKPMKKNCDFCPFSTYCNAK